VPSQNFCHLIPFFVLILTILACNLPGNTATVQQPVDVESTQPAPIIDSVTATVFIPTAILATSVPTETVTLVASPTVSVVSIKADGATSMSDVDRELVTIQFLVCLSRN